MGRINHYLIGAGLPVLRTALVDGAHRLVHKNGPIGSGTPVGWQVHLDERRARRKRTYELIRAIGAMRCGDQSNPRRIDVELYHCKFSLQPNAGSRVDDLYVVCGQAQRSIVWLHNRDRRKDLFSHLLKRNEQRVDAGRPTRFEVGDDAKLIQLRDLSKRCELRLSVFAVQPGVSQAKVSSSQLTLLSVVDRYLQETYQLDFRLWCHA